MPDKQNGHQVSSDDNSSVKRFKPDKAVMVISPPVTVYKKSFLFYLQVKDTAFYLFQCLNIDKEGLKNKLLFV